MRVPQIILTSSHHAILAFGLACFIVYGSLIPLVFQYIPLDQAIELFRESMTIPRHLSRTDVLANILLYLPLGYLLTATACVDRPRWHSLGIAPFALTVCVGMGFVVEFLQTYVPARNTCLADIIANGTGGAVGIALWVFAGQRITNWSRRVWSTRMGHGLAGLLLPGYLFFLLILRLVPFDLTLDPGEIVHKFRQGKIRLVPLANIGDPSAFLEKHAWNAAFFFPIGWMSAFLPGSFWTRTASFVPISFFAIALALAYELAQLFVISRFVDIDEVLSGACAICIGWMAARAYGARSDRDPLSAESSELYRNVALVSFAAWIALAVFITWRPFDFRADSAFVRHRLANVCWIPFLDYQAQDYIHILEQILTKGILFGVGGALLAYLVPGLRLFRILVAGGLVSLLAVFLEFGQLLLEVRYFSVTDIVIEATAAFAAAWLVATAPAARRTWT